MPVRPRLPLPALPRGGRFRQGDTLIKQTFYGFRMHVRMAWPGLITHFSVAPANAHELSVLPEIVEGTRGAVVWDRNYHSPKTIKKISLARWA